VENREHKTYALYCYIITQSYTTYIGYMSSRVLRSFGFVNRP